MKRNSLSSLTVVLLAVFLLIPGCGKGNGPAESGGSGALLKTIKAALENTGLNIDAGEVTTAEGSGGRQSVTFNNAVITIDTSGLKGMGMAQGEMPVKIDQMVFDYGEEEKSLQLVSCKGIAVDMKFTYLETTGSNSRDMSLKFSVGNLTFDHYDIGPLLGTKAKTPMELAGELMMKNPTIKSTADKVVYEIDMTMIDNKQMLMHLKCGKIKGGQSFSPEVFMGLYVKDSGNPAPDFAKFLEEGKAIFDFYAEIEAFEIAIIIDDKALGGGKMDSTRLKYYLKPDNAKSAFIYGSDWGVTGLTLFFPDYPKVEKLGSLEELDLKFSMGNLGTGLAQAYFDLMQKSVEMNAAGKSGELAQQQAAMGIKLMTEFMASKPTMKMSIAPLKHDLGELEAEGDFRFDSFMSTPVGKASVTFFNMEGIREKLKAGDILPVEAGRAILKMLEGIVVTGDDGNGTITFETRADKPGQFLLNGIPVGKEPGVSM
ncbi:MAG: hypothetical protein GY940_45905 [bacterium]|nr:hypothetical protein [bacterium]